MNATKQPNAKVSADIALDDENLDQVVGGATAIEYGLIAALVGIALGTNLSGASAQATGTATVKK